MVSCGFFFFVFQKVRVVGSAYEPTMRFWLTGRDNRNFCLNVSLAAIVLFYSEGRVRSTNGWTGRQDRKDKESSRAMVEEFYSVGAH